jgi:hypothetical protein
MFVPSSCSFIFHARPIQRAASQYLETIARLPFGNLGLKAFDPRVHDMHVAVYKFGGDCLPEEWIVV